MPILIYDSTFEGFLTVVFECYARKIIPIDIRKDRDFQNTLFAECLNIQTDQKKAERVWNGVQKKLHQRNKDLPFVTFLSEDDGIEMKLFRFIKRVFDSERMIDTDYGDRDVLELRKIKRKVMQESMRMLQFVRFQKTKDGLYFSPIEPQYDVLPFTIKHFKDRFADQPWLIYDLKRDYGIHYNLKTTEEVVLTEKTFSELNGKLDEFLLQEEELSYQTLWKNYFDSINIKERKNLKLQRQQMPQRYWKFLPEKAML
ncbi:TIGR03915 family putative DNA repair protein [Sunxiuqinia sp. A32]|uniref:TIGR03915 family putative DNA repair protein n=1 Tax=Sunxiuqinia sp. A32 TaxID=3461496 RepID=UPI004045AAAB